MKWTSLLLRKVCKYLGLTKCIYICFSFVTENSSNHFVLKVSSNSFTHELQPVTYVKQLYVTSSTTCNTIPEYPGFTALAVFGQVVYMAS